MTDDDERQEAGSPRRRARFTKESAAGLGVLAGIIAAIYGGLTWFRRRAEDDRKR